MNSQWIFFAFLVGAALSLSEFETLRFSVPRFDSSISNRFSFVNSKLDSSSGTIQLTKDLTNSAGAAWYGQKVYVKGMKTKFSFQIASTATGSSQGVTFVIQDSATGLFSIGGNGAGIGYAAPVSTKFEGIEQSVVIEFDCIRDLDMGDQSDSHASVHARRYDTNSAKEEFSLASFIYMPFFCNKTTTCEITYEPGQLTVSISDIPEPIIKHTMKLEDYIQFKDSKSAYIGFTASTGINAGIQEILNWSYEFLGVVNGKNSYATGTGISKATAGIVTYFDIITVDQYGNNYPVGNAKVNIQFTGPSNVEYNINDNNDGTYRVSYSAKVSGKYDVKIILNSENIGGGPYTITLSPNVIDPLLTTIEEIPITIDVDKLVTVVITTYDTYSNKLESGGAKVVSSLTPINTQDSARVTDNRNGLYTLQYTVFKATDYSLKITVNDYEINGSPFNFKSNPGPLDAKSSVVEGVETVSDAGDSQVIRVISHDKFGNRIYVGKANFDVYLTQESPGSSITKSDFENGVYESTIYIQKSGKYTLNIRLNGINADKSPYLISVNPDVINVPNCIAEGGALENGKAGDISSFNIVTKDKFDNTITSKVSTKFIAIIAGGINITASTSNNDDGTVTVAYTPTISGNYITYVQAESQFVKNTPASTFIKTSYVSGPTSSPVDPSYPFLTGRAKETTFVQIQSRDSYGNELEVGGANVNVTIVSKKKEPIIAKVVDNQNGTYSIYYTPEKKQTGDYVMTILIENLNIQDSPFNLKILGVDNTTTVAVSVCVSLIIICLIAVVSLAAYRRYKKNQGYSLIQQQRN